MAEEGGSCQGGPRQLQNNGQPGHKQAEREKRMSGRVQNPALRRCGMRLTGVEERKMRPGSGCFVSSKIQTQTGVTFEGEYTNTFLYTHFHFVQ